MMRYSLKKKIRENSIFALIILLYTTFFQAMYCWMRYDTVTANVDLLSWLFSLLCNYVPILLLGFGIMCVSRYTLRIGSLGKKIAIDMGAMAIMLAVVNYLFYIVTGMSVNWGGAIFNSIMVLMGVEFWLLSMQKQRSLRRENLLTRENMAMKYEIQKAYVNPHFLYNTLDLLSSLIEEGRNEEAITFITRLSSYYRTMTRKSNAMLRPFSEELKSVTNYLEVVKYHYGEALSLEVSGDEERDPQLIPFALQLLIENVIKHNKITPATPVRIAITVNGEGVVVANNCNPKETSNLKSSGIGLSYLKNLYSSHGKKVAIESNSSGFRVTLPYLN